MAWLLRSNPEVLVQTLDIDNQEFAGSCLFDEEAHLQMTCFHSFASKKQQHHNTKEQ